MKSKSHVPRRFPPMRAASVFLAHFATARMRVPYCAISTFGSGYAQEVMAGGDVGGALHVLPPRVFTVLLPCLVTQCGLRRQVVVAGGGAADGRFGLLKLCLA